jgi:hypothetical protein
VVYDTLDGIAHEQQKVTITYNDDEPESGEVTIAVNAWEGSTGEVIDPVIYFGGVPKELFRERRPAPRRAPAEGSRPARRDHDSDAVTLAEALAPYVATTAPHVCPPWATRCAAAPDGGPDARRCPSRGRGGGESSRA